MTSQKNRRFQNFFGQCLLPCNADSTPQVDYKIEQFYKINLCLIFYR